MNIKGVIFDLDGTLIDSMPVWDDLGELYLKSKGLKARDGLAQILLPMSLLETAKYFRTEYGVTDPVQTILEDVNQLLAHAYQHEILLKSGATRLVQFLKEQGVKMCVATATDHALSEAVLARTGILPYLEGIITCGEIGFGKDCPDVFLAALNLLKTDIRQACVFEDTLHSMKTAKAAGFFTVAVSDDASHAHQTQIKDLANIYLVDLVDFQERFCAGKVDWT